MATEILEMALDAVTLDTSNPLVVFGGASLPRMMTINIPLEYKDGRLPVPFRSGGVDPRFPSDPLIGAPRTCKVHFEELYTTATPNYRAVYDKYALAFGDGRVIALLFRTTDGLLRIRGARLLSFPFDISASTPLNAILDMTFAVEFYSHDLFPTGAQFYDNTFQYDASNYDTPGVVLPIVGSSQSATFTTAATAVVFDVTVQLIGPGDGPFTIAIYYGPNNTLYSAVTINDSLIVEVNGYIDYYQIESGSQTVTRNGVEVFDMGKVIFPPGQNDWLRVGTVTNTVIVTAAGTGLGASTALYLAYTPHYL